MNLETQSTEARIEQLQGKEAILHTWEKFASKDLQIRERSYLKGLKERMRQVRNYILHRADPKANISKPNASSH